jgi:hypothetical protein
MPVVLFASVIFQIGSRIYAYLTLTGIFPIFASWEAKIMGMSHHAWLLFFFLFFAMLTWKYSQLFEKLWLLLFSGAQTQGVAYSRQILYH